jgi:hypothetical protein
MGRQERILEQIKMEEIPAETYNGIDLKEKISGLHESDRAILDRYSADSMRQIVLDKLSASTSDKQKSRKFTFKYRWGFIGVPAAIAAALYTALVLPPFLYSRKNAVENSFPGKTTGIERIKGAGAQIYLYKKEEQDAVQLYNQSFINGGDYIQIGYTAAGAKYGFIISIDGNGTVTQHYPDYGYNAAELNAGGEVLLNYSYQLDNAPSFERFLFITGNNSFNTRDFINTLKHLENRKSARTADFLTYLPPYTKMSSIVLLKKE